MACAHGDGIAGTEYRLVVSSNNTITMEGVAYGRVRLTSALRYVRSYRGAVVPLKYRVYGRSSCGMTLSHRIPMASGAPLRDTAFSTLALRHRRESHSRARERRLGKREKRRRTPTCVCASSCSRSSVYFSDHDANMAAISRSYRRSLFARRGRTNKRARASERARLSRFIINRRL